MNRWKLFRLKNLMLFGNFISNVIGVQVVDTIARRSVSPPPPEVQSLIKHVDAVFLPLSVVLPVSLMLMYERPIRRYLNLIYRQSVPSAATALKARQRLLNEPFVMIAMDMAIWVAAAIVYPVFLASAHPGAVNTGRVFFQTILVGLVTSIIAFFVLQYSLQKRMVPHFFPNGGLCAVPRTLRIRIFIRIAALVLACNTIPCIAFLGTLKASTYSPAGAEQLLDMLRGSIFVNCLIFMGVGLLLTALVSSNLARPFGEIIEVLHGVKNGSLDRKVRVTSNDEIGYTGDVINEMTEGLKEREQMRRSLDLAREVQQNLLPGHPPAVESLDIAGTSIYCDQTGGDYFDFIRPEGSDSGKIGLVVGDVSGHGIPSALLMATARACLRQRAFLPGTAAQIVTDVNRQLSEDVEETGQFMTLFYLVIHTEQMALTWVRAGHEPGLVYNPEIDTFKSLRGPGIALGIDAQWPYDQQEMAGLARGQVIVLGTDGIWEARDAGGRMYGIDRMKQLVRRHHTDSAENIIRHVVADLRRFQNGTTAEDDITLVVAKFDPPADPNHRKSDHA